MPSGIYSIRDTIKLINLYIIKTKKDNLIMASSNQFLLIWQQISDNPFFFLLSTKCLSVCKCVCVWVIDEKFFQWFEAEWNIAKF